MLQYTPRRRRLGACEALPERTSMTNTHRPWIFAGLLLAPVGPAACDGDDPSQTSDTSSDSSTATSTSSTSSDPSADETGSGTELHPAFAEFDADNTDISIDGSEVLIESNGLPNHTSPYWGSDHPLYTEPTVAVGLAPGNIEEFGGLISLRLPTSPQLADSTTATGLGAIGIAVSGSVIYNDQEGPNIPLEGAVMSLDYTGAHTGPQSYHYHLEPTAWSFDDTALIGVISDGFFLYGRRCVDDEYPDDLDTSGGHTAQTPHNTEGEYHYHIQNVAYLDQYYILFPGDYQGTPNSVAFN